MSQDDNIPTLTDLIRNGQEPAEQGPDVDLIVNDDDREDITLDLATHQALGTARNGPPEDSPPLSDALGADGELENLDALTEDTGISELLIEEEIRLILDKHMEAAYEEILRLIQHKIR